jgi:hypothetical protein
MVESKFSRNVHLVSWPTALEVLAAVVRRDANDRQYWPMGPGSDAAAHGVRKS